MNFTWSITYIGTDCYRLEILRGKTVIYGNVYVGRMIALAALEDYMDKYLGENSLDVYSIKGEYKA